MLFCACLSPELDSLTDLTCHKGCNDNEEDSRCSVIWPYLAAASSWPSPSALSDGLSAVLCAQIHKHTHVQGAQGANAVNSHLYSGLCCLTLWPTGAQSNHSTTKHFSTGSHTLCLSPSLSFSQPFNLISLM